MEKSMVNSQKEFQEEILRRMTQRKATMKELAKDSIKRKATLDLTTKKEKEIENEQILKDEAIEINNDNSLEILSDNEMANEDIIKEESLSRVASRENSMNQSKASLFNFRSKHNQSHEPNLKRNNLSFINSKFGIDDIKLKLIDNDVNKTIDYSGKRSNLTTNKTSLILPPISVGNMISTFDLNEHLNNKQGNKIKSRFVSPTNSFKNIGVVTNRSKISIKSEIADKFIHSPTSNDVIVKKPSGLSPDQSYDTLDLALPNIDTSKIHRLAKRPNKPKLLSMSTHIPSDVLITKKTRRQVEFIKNTAMAKLNKRFKML